MHLRHTYNRVLLKLNRFFKFVDGGRNLISIDSPIAQNYEPRFITPLKSEWPFGWRTFHELREKHGPVLFNDVIVSVESGNVFKQIGNNFFYFLESDYRHHYQALWSRRRPSKIPKLHIKESCVVIPHRSGNFYHFVIEEFPDILREIDCDPERIFASEKLPRFARDILEKSYTIEYLKERELFASALIKMPKVATEDSRHSKNRLDIVRNYFSDIEIDHSSESRIFILRNPNDFFETQVSKVFENLGFSVFRLTDMSIFEQVRLFKSATHVAGFGGAGFTGLVFARSSETSIILIELVDVRADSYHWKRGLVGVFWKPYCHSLGIHYSNLLVSEIESLETRVKTII